MDSFATHQQALCAAVTFTKGAILELGCGEYSTPLLHELARNRQLVSLETDITWLQKFTHFTSPWHTLRLANYDTDPVFSQEWSVVLVDHTPPARRGPDVSRLRAKTQLFVLHDTEGIGYFYHTIQPHFKYRLDFVFISDGKLYPSTAIVSDSSFLGLEPCETKFHIHKIRDIDIIEYY